jgi:hypothetical protein
MAVNFFPQSMNGIKKAGEISPAFRDLNFKLSFGLWFYFQFGIIFTDIQFINDVGGTA